MPRAASPKPKTQAPLAKADWDRGQLSLRLTPARRERLLQIARDMPVGSTPGEAVDRAIERALAPATTTAGDAALARLDALEEMIESLGRQRARDATLARAASDETLREVRALAGLMSAVATSPNDSEGGEWGSDAACAPSLRSWLAGRPRSAEAVVAFGRWRSKTRLADKTVCVEFEIAPAGSAAARSVVRVSPLPAASPLARVDENAPIRFTCQRDALGRWSVEARHLNADRSLGAFVCQLMV